MSHLNPSRAGLRTPNPLCPKCGKSTDATPAARRRRHYGCRACVKTYNNRYYAANLSAPTEQERAVVWAVAKVFEKRKDLRP